MIERSRARFTLQASHPHVPKAIFSSLLFCLPALLLIVFVLLPARPARAATLTVCPTGGQYATIQEAVNAANAGDVIQICGGTYVESVNLDLMGSSGGSKGDITLQGVGEVLISPAAGKAIHLIGFPGNVVLDNIHATSPESTAIYLNSIDGAFTMNGGGASNVANGAGLMILSLGGDATITGTRFLNNRGAGVEIFSAFGFGCEAPADPPEIAITNVETSDNWEEGILLFLSRNDVRIDNSQAVNNLRVGFNVLSVNGCEDNIVTVTGSSAIDNGLAGFRLDAAHLQIIDSVATGNGTNGINQTFSQPAVAAAAAAGPWSTEILRTSASSNSLDGVRVDNSNFVTMSHISVGSNGESGVRLALPPTGDGQFTIDSSVAFNNQVGIQLEETAAPPSVRAAAALTTRFNGNIVCQNSDAGLSVGGATARDYNAAGNFWGNSNGPSHPVKNPNGAGNAVKDAGNGGAGNVIFAPWIEDGLVTISPAVTTVGVPVLITVTFPAGAGPGLTNQPGDPSSPAAIFVAATNNGELKTPYGEGPAVGARLGETGVMTAVLTPIIPGIASLFFSGECSLQARGSVLVIQPSIQVAKNPPTQTVVSGGSASFQVAITNTGNITLTNIAVSDPAAPTCGRSLSDLGPGQGASFTCTQASVTASYTNQITVTGNPLTDPPLQAPVTATAAAQVVVINPGLAISKNPPIQAVVSGGSATFQVAITNTGGISLTNVSVSDPQAPACERLLSDLGPGQGTSFTCTQAGVTASYTNRITVTADLPATPADPKLGAAALVAPAAAAAAAARVVAVNPGLSAVKSVGLEPDACAPAGPLTAAISSSLYYCITLVNTGDVTLTQHTVADLPLGIAPTPVDIALAPGASLAITRSLLPALGPVVMTGAITNVVSITSTAGITDVGGVLLPVAGVQVHSAADVTVDPLPTGLTPEPEPVNATQWLYLPTLRH